MLMPLPFIKSSIFTLDSVGNGNKLKTYDTNTYIHKRWHTDTGPVNSLYVYINMQYIWWQTIRMETAERNEHVAFGVCLCALLCLAWFGSAICTVRIGCTVLCLVCVFVCLISPSCVLALDMLFNFPAQSTVPPADYRWVTSFGLS